MKIDKNSVVQFHYILTDADSNEQIETSRDGDPVLYLHGHRNIVSGLEEAMLGREKGDVFSVTVPPEKAYGLRQENRQQRVPVKHLLLAKKTQPKAGMTVHVQTDQGPMPATVVKAGKFTVDLDLNHPFAGKNLQFDVEIIAMREAEADEVAHGHAHGIGGHQH